MKKLLIIVLLLVYGVSATGATVHLHFCCGKLDDISFSVRDKKACPSRDVFTKKCCEDQQVELKVKADHQPVGKWVDTLKSFTFLGHTASFHSPAALYWTRVAQFTIGPPHEHASVPLYIQNRVFRI